LVTCFIIDTKQDDEERAVGRKKPQHNTINSQAITKLKKAQQANNQHTQDDKNANDQRPKPRKKSKLLV
jgi:hypothetical protein